MVNKSGKSTIADKGPEIPDIDQVMESGFSTVGSLGLSLCGAKLLPDELEITPTSGGKIEHNR